MREGIRLFKGGKYEQALEALLQIDVPPEQYPEQAYYLGLSYAKLEQFDEALLYLEQVAASDLDFARIFQGRLIIGYIYAVTERYRLAEFEFNQLLEEGYESPKVYAALAFTLYKQEKTAQSISLLEKALELDPENPNALNSLGFILADKEIRVGVALQYCRRAYDHNPRNPAYQDSLGWAQFKCGNIREAIRYLSMARQQMKGNSEVERHWAVVSRAAEKV
ncbi:tetratricopeptide repeat protein [Spirochaeta africana]|uniref:Tetratricopeptide repeat protein n=1 Tax=Spirochaeta africana (strain ATCC 700263 / DSM 8902 / Z-7692) TaxID=889378 RepID=H9UKE0_SPIAZ|nr:tetratricopeptide repeat protein [Spirochaeta africana]AFG37983.1 tetratricopeptide repeat protein [Spirochaeta africana DSM 8902]